MMWKPFLIARAMVSVLAILMFAASLNQAAQAQPRVDREQIRWKTEQQVRSLLGEPKSIRGPVGTHATYTLWKYDDVTVAFANKRAFHLFVNDSLQRRVTGGANR